MTMKTYTAFCQEADLTGTIWIASVEAESPAEAGRLAIETCAEAWEMEPDEVVLIGLAKGDVKIVFWDDSGTSLADLEGEHTL